MKIVKHSCAVNSISITTPCAIVVPADNVVLTFRSPWNSTLTNPAAAIPPHNWTINSNTPLTQEIAPINTIPTVTAGLNKPPLMRKNTHALAAREKPKLSDMYKSWEGFFCCTVVITVLPVLVFEEMLATCVPAKAKNKNAIVPTNSPSMATVCPRNVGGKRRSRPRIGVEAEEGASVFMRREKEGAASWWVRTVGARVWVGERALLVLCLERRESGAG